MRRKILIITALCLFGGATAAYAASAINDYSGTKQTFSRGVGTAKKPVGVGFVQDLRAKNLDSSKAAFVLVDITTKIYGLKSNAAKFPTCSDKKMSSLKSDSFCPKGSKFATGHVNSLIGDSTLAMSSRFQCNPGLDVFHAGGNKLWFFFTTSLKNACGPLHTGDTAPYPGFITQQGKWQVTDVPLPPDISTRVAGHSNLYGSLSREVLTWAKLSTKVKGKTVFANESIGCQKGKRPWEIDFTAVDGSGKKVTQKVKGSSKC